MTVEVVEYPPIYVVGDVTKPGEYPFRNQMTVLQALALSGGELKPEGMVSEKQIMLAADLRTMDRNLLRAEAKIARLQAEASGTKNAKDIVFPSHIGGFDAELFAEVTTQEKTIFATRARELDRQAKSLDELRGLLKREIEVLEEKNKAIDDQTAAAESQLAAVSTLVEKGIAVASRKSDLESKVATTELIGSTWSLLLCERDKQSPKQRAISMASTTGNRPKSLLNCNKNGLISIS